MKYVIVGCAVLIAGTSLALAGQLVAKSPNLVPVASKMKNGRIFVGNIGSAVAGPFKVTVECNAVGRRGGCAPDPSPREAAPYEDPAFPNKVTVSVPGLAQGAVFNHKITFWKSLTWAPGDYQFTVVADAGATVGETNEGDNTDTTVMHVP